MKNIILLFCLAFGMSACENDAPKTPETSTKPIASAGTSAFGAGEFIPSGEPQQMRGLLMQNLGVTGFLSSPYQKIFKVIDTTNTLDAAYAKAVGRLRYNSEPVYTVMTGVVGMPSASGPQEFKLYKIDTMVAKTAANVGSLEFPYDFWCYGPDWEIEISGFENGIFYQHEGENIAFCGRWTKPSYDGKSYTYEIPYNETMNEDFTVVVTKEPAVDPKTGKTYNYSASVTARGKTFKGWAIRGLGQFPTK